MKHWHHTTDKRFYGAIVNVFDLDACRAFYADVLGLGPPVVDSPFWVEFELVPGQMVLALRPVAGQPGEEPVRQGQTAWCLEVADAEALTRRLRDCGYPPRGATTLPTGARIVTFHDPEGNPFSVLHHEQE